MAKVRLYLVNTNEQQQQQFLLKILKIGHYKRASHTQTNFIFSIRSVEIEIIKKKK